MSALRELAGAPGARRWVCTHGYCASIWGVTLNETPPLSASDAYYHVAAHHWDGAEREADLEMLARARLSEDTVHRALGTDEWYLPITDYE